MMPVTKIREIAKYVQDECIFCRMLFLNFYISHPDWQSTDKGPIAVGVARVSASQSAGLLGGAWAVYSDILMSEVSPNPPSDCIPPNPAFKIGSAIEGNGNGL